QTQALKSYARHAVPEVSCQPNRSPPLGREALLRRSKPHATPQQCIEPSAGGRTWRAWNLLGPSLEQTEAERPTPPVDKRQVVGEGDEMHAHEQCDAQLHEEQARQDAATSPREKGRKNRQQLDC